MSYAKMSIPKRVFKPYLVSWNTDCNGHSSRFRPIKKEKSCSSVLVYPLCPTSSWNTDTSLELRFCPALLLESKSHLSLSLYISLSNYLSPLFPPSISLLSSCPKFTCGDPGWNIYPGEMSKSWHNILPPSSNLLSYINSVVLNEHFCLYRDIPSHSSYHPFPLSVLHVEPLTISYILWSMWFHI